ncbi:uncharacterized protein LOC142163933 [Nicotiana tabacum]|uniref:Uncharacterized protein LOC142163933 n=1 Tax=Nicotiana tabacum TaxID=4097 RepID=A0AC58RWT1_TOBAC
MRRFVSQNWAQAANPDLYLHDEGYYMIKFQTIEDLNAVYYSGPYSINNRPIILKPWTPEFDFNTEFPTEIPLWVKFPNLPMNCWSSNSLSRIASVIGTPIFADECTSKQTRISYARMLVEVNVTRELPEAITVLDPNGRQFTQEVIFDWKPEFCQLCQVVGHKCPPPPKAGTQNHAPQERRREPRKVTME